MPRCEANGLLSNVSNVFLVRKNKKTKTKTKTNVQKLTVETTSDIVLQSAGVEWTDGRTVAATAAELTLICNCEIITSAYFDFCMYCLEFTTIKTRRVSEDGVTAEYNTVFNSVRTWLSRICVFVGQ